MERLTGQRARITILPADERVLYRVDQEGVWGWYPVTDFMSAQELIQWFEGIKWAVRYLKKEAILEKLAKSC